MGSCGSTVQRGRTTYFAIVLSMPSVESVADLSLPGSSLTMLTIPKLRFATRCQLGQRELTTGIRNLHSRHRSRAGDQDQNGHVR
ncbi:MAG: hypothetical protein CMJ48_03030 [Planctomycetaceae bacterium]|nr:hypothetical protein [Planctomycetaceae bacterium]